MLAIDFLRRASENTSQQSKDVLIVVLQRLILEDHFGSETRLMVRKNMAAEKWELVDILQRIAPDRAAGLVTQADSAVLQRVLQHHLHKRVDHT
jgi:hypothetical protein